MRGRLGDRARVNRSFIEAISVSNVLLGTVIVAQVFQDVEQHAPPCELVHDECASFEEVYRHVFDLSANARKSEMVLKDGRKHVFGFERIQSLSFANSERQPILRAADYLVASCTSFGQQAFVGKTIDESLAQASFQAIGGILMWAMSQSLPEEDRCPKIGELFASDRWVGKCSAEMMRWMSKFTSN